MQPSEHLEAGRAAQQRADWAAAEQHYRAAGSAGRLPLAWLAYARGEHGQAKAALAPLLAEPLATAWLLQGHLALSAGEGEAALRHYRQALALDPGEALALLAIGQAQLRLGRPAEAHAALADYLRARPADAEAWSLLARACQSLDLICQEALCLERALALRPDDFALLERRLLAWIYLGQREGVARHFEHCLQLSPAGERWYASRPPALRAALERARPLLHYQHLLICYGDPAYSDAALLDYVATLPAPAGEPLPPAPAYEPGRPLRLGYLSRELGGYSSGAALWPLLRHHSAAVALYAYHDATPDKHSTETARFRERFAHWREVWALDNRELAERIRADGIDVLIDMGGITNAERNGVYAYQPAPVQLGGLGFGFSACHRAIGYFLGDPRIPPAIAARFPETVLPLRSHFHWQPPPESLAPGEPPCLQTGLITFGCSNSLNKLNPRVLALWARILQALPTALLYLKTPVLGDEQAQAYWFALWASHGIGPERLRFAGQRGNHRAEFYPKIDIALDPFPYQGGVTTCEALWMGVPVLTLRHPDWAARAVSAGILEQIGHGDWVCASEQAYFERALAWAGDPDCLRRMRRELRPRLLASPICDGAGAAAELEALCLSLRQAADEASPASAPGGPALGAPA